MSQSEVDFFGRKHLYCHHILYSSGVRKQCAFPPCQPEKGAAPLTIKELSFEYEPYIISLRQEFHKNPELSLHEERTVRRICEELDRWGIPHETTGHNNVVGLITGAKPGKRIAIRGDIDALPIDEENDVPYRSTVPGVMHACGHDGHAAILLAVGRALQELREELCGSVYLCFQVAEEVGAGADELVAYLKGKGGVDQAIGTHLDGGSDAGTINLPGGPTMAGATGFEIDVMGVGGHGSRPDKAVDPIKPACDIVLKIAQIPGQRHDPFDTCVVSPCQIVAGSKNNIIPETAHIAGNIRFFKYGDGERIVETIRLIAINTAKAYGATATVTSQVMSPMPVINDEEAAARGRKIAQEIGLKLAPPRNPTMGSDNFSEFLAAFPGFYCDTGANCKRPGASGNHHNPKFDLDESALRAVMEFLATYAYRYLND